jgi:hypothetical protein
MKKLVVIGLTILLLAPVASAEKITVTIENLAPVGGNFLTPLWVGFHNGSFDIYNQGDPASSALERLAEDGNTGPLSADFLASGAGVLDGTLVGPLAPGDVATAMFDLDGTLPTSRFFSYAAMVIPSNDAFIANGDPMAHQIFSNTGSALGADFFLLGNEVLDAGTEVNDEIPANTAFFGQAAADTGVDENGVVMFHPGFNPVGSGGILDDPTFSNADFTRPGYPVAQIRVFGVPEPGTMLLFGSALIGIAGLARKRQLKV